MSFGSGASTSGVGFGNPGDESRIMEEVRRP
jgi:hypothetical protein